MALSSEKRISLPQIITCVAGALLASSVLGSENITNVNSVTEFLITNTTMDGAPLTVEYVKENAKHLIDAANGIALAGLSGVLASIGVLSHGTKGYSFDDDNHKAFHNNSWLFNWSSNKKSFAFHTRS